MDVVSLCTLPVASLLWQPRPNAWMLTFVCKATYRLKPNESSLSAEQERIHKRDCHWSDDPGWSLYAPTDLVPIRPKADVVLVGHAFAPGGVPVRSLMTRLVVGEVDKSIEVFSDRAFTQDGVLHDGSRFTKMPLLWERAAGGPDTQNPVGMRSDRRDSLGRRLVPNLQPPGVTISQPDDVIESIGYGPIAPTWPLRLQKLGRYVGSWSDQDWTGQPLPADMDASYFNTAPRDQQTSVLRENERLVLDHLHPDHAHLVTNLSGHKPKAFVKRPGKDPQALSMRPDLLWIHTDRALCTLTFRGQVALEHATEKGLIQVALEDPGQVLHWDDVERISEPVETLPPAQLGGDEGPLGSTLAAPLQPAGSALPFAAAGGAAAAEPAGPQRVAGTPFVAARPRQESSPDLGAPPVTQPQAQAQPGLAGTPFVAARPRQESSPDLQAPAMVPRPTPPPPPQRVVAQPPMVASPPPLPVTPPLAVASPPLHAAPPPRTIGEAAVQPLPIRPASVDPRGGVREASDAAAGASASVLAQPATAVKAAPSPAPAVRLAAKPTPDAREILELIWFDPECLPRVRRQPTWRNILKELEKKPLDKEMDDPALAKEPMAIEDRREIFEILVHGEATDAEGLQEALGGAVREDGKFMAPLRLVAAELAFPFDELETLKAIVTTVTPLIGNDEQLKSTVDVAQDFLKLPALKSAPAVADGLSSRIREAFAQGRRSVPANYLDTQTERALLDQRSYQKRKVFGAPYLRTLAQPLGSSQLIPAYLTDSVAEQLPLYQRFRARLIAEVHLQVDQYESQPMALRILALLRVLPAMKRV